MQPEKKPIPLIKKFYSKKIPTNPKFNNTKPIVETGTTMKVVQVLADNQISRRKQETFHRINSKHLNELMKNDKKGESVFDLFDENNNKRYSYQTFFRNQSPIQRSKNKSK